MISLVSSERIFVVALIKEWILVLGRSALEGNHENHFFLSKRIISEKGRCTRKCWSKETFNGTFLSNCDQCIENSINSATGLD